MSNRSTAFNVVAGLIALIAVGAVAWLLFLRDDGGTEATVGADAQLVSPDSLSEYAGSVDGPVYWAGRQGNTGLEFTALEDGSTYIRYLTPDAVAGDPRPGFLTVATYPVDDSEAALQAAIGREGAVELGTVGGVTVVTNKDSPTSVYLAPTPTVEVEVYDPSAERAAEVALSGAIQPVP